MNNFDQALAIKNFTESNGEILIEKMKVIVKWNYVFDFLSLINDLKASVSDKHENNLMKLYDVVKHKVSYSTITGYSDYTIYHFKKDLQKLIINLFTVNISLPDSVILEVCTSSRDFREVLGSVKSLFYDIRRDNFVYVIKDYICSKYMDRYKFVILEYILFNDNFYTTKITSTIVEIYYFVIKNSFSHNKYKMFVLVSKIIKKFDMKVDDLLQELFIESFFYEDEKVDIEIIKYLLENFYVDLNCKIEMKLITSVYYTRPDASITISYGYLNFYKSTGHLDLLNQGYTAYQIYGKFTRTKK